MILRSDGLAGVNSILINVYLRGEAKRLGGLVLGTVDDPVGHDFAVDALDLDFAVGFAMQLVF